MKQAAHRRPGTAVFGTACSQAAVSVQSYRSGAAFRHVLPGRPVFTAHGGEHALAGFMAIIDAMMSFVKDRGDSLHSMRYVWCSGSALLHAPVQPGNLSLQAKL